MHRFFVCLFKMRLINR